MGRETSLVLAIEPDSARADALRQMVRERLGVELVLVSSPYAAIVAMNRQLPELLLFSSSLSDRNQNKIIAHYRSLTDGRDPQTLIIPIFRDSADDSKQGSRFSFKWKRQARGSSSDVFLDTIANYLKRAEQAVVPEAEPANQPSRPPQPIARLDDAPAGAAESVGQPEPAADPLAGTAAGAGTQAPEPAVPEAVLPTEEPTLTWPNPSPEESSDESFRLVEVGEEVVLDLSPALPEVEEVETTSAPDLSPLPDPMAASTAGPLAPDEIDRPTVADDLVEAPAAADAAAHVGLPDEPVLQGPGTDQPTALDEAFAPPSGSPDAPVTIDDFLSEFAADTTSPGDDFEVLAPLEPVAQREPAERLSVDLSSLFDEYHIDPGTMAIEVDETFDRDDGGTAGDGVDLSPMLDVEAPRPVPVDPGIDPEVHAAEIALIKLEAEQKLASELERLRLEAVHQREEELARLQQEAEALRQQTVAQARESAEAQARETWAAELARVRAEAERTVAEALNRVKTEAEQTLTSEVMRAREEAEKERLAQLEVVQAALERARQDAEAVRLAQLAHAQAAEERVDSVTRQAREAEAQAAQERLAQMERLQAEAEAVRQAAVARARAEAESEAREALMAELARVRAEAEQTLTDTLSRVKHEAEHTLTAEVSRAREEAELSRSEELARIQEEVNARVSEATRLAREAAEAEAARAFSGELARARSQAEQTFASELARIKSETELVVAETERARANAYVEREADAARAQAEAEALRQAAIAEARAAAEEAATRATEREVARVKAEAEARVQEEVERLRAEAERARIEAERARTERSEAALEAEKVREAAREVEREVERVRAASAEQLQRELERVKSEAERAREAERAAAREETERLRESAAEEARARAEAALKAELDRVRSESESRLAAEVIQLRAEADQHRAAELAELRAQMSQVRDSAAQQAQKAAAEAIAAEVARATKERPPSPYPPRPEGARPASPYAPPAQESRGFSIPQHHRVPTADLSHHAPRPQAPYQSAAPPRPAKDLWATPTPAVPPPATPAWKKWRIPALFAIVLIGAGTASYNWLPVSVKWTSSEESAPAQEPEPEAQPAAPARRTGAEVRLTSTPPGAAISVDGRDRGVTPLTLSDLTVGTHTVVFEADGFAITRSIRVRSDQALTIAQDMTAGFLSVFSRIPADVLIDGKTAGSTEDGQILVAPGAHTVVLENARFNFKSEFTVDIKPGEVTAHTVTLPMGALVVNTEAGAEIWIEGERAGIAPLGPIAVPIGTREVVVRHASGEARQSAEIVYGRQAEITLNVSTQPGPPASALPVQMPPLSAPASGPRPTVP